MTARAVRSPPSAPWLCGCVFFDGFGERRNNLEEVADNAIIGDFKNWRILIFVDSHDAARAFHAHHVLNRATDPQRQIKLWRNGLARAADLPLHGQPAFV